MDYPDLELKKKVEPSKTLNIVVVGHVDSGKSTLVGKLMHLNTLLVQNLNFYFVMLCSNNTRLDIYSNIDHSILLDYTVSSDELSHELHWKVSSTLWSCCSISEPTPIPIKSSWILLQKSFASSDCTLFRWLHGNLRNKIQNFFMCPHIVCWMEKGSNNSQHWFLIVLACFQKFRTWFSSQDIWLPHINWISSRQMLDGVSLKQTF